MFFQKRLSHWIFYTLVLLILGCASPKTPTGGPRDETPPSIIPETSTPNHQTHFKDKTITITFDEWITLKDVYKQLVVSPLLPKDPEIKQKGKAIIITLPDSLKAETTYTLHFGNAIADLNEGNILENFAFVFSTGAVLDSARLSGNLIDAVTLKPAEGVWVMLYPIGEDSAVYKRKPEYLAKTNKEGIWEMANIRPDSFNLVALKDDNLNFLYDQESELLGWSGEVVYTLSPSTVIPELKVFPKSKRISIKESFHPFPGWLKLVIEASPPKPVPILIPEIENSITEWQGDTLHIWYPSGTNYAGFAVLNDDSTRIRISSGISRLNSSMPISALSGRLHPAASAQYTTELPISSIDTSRIKLSRDTLGLIPFTLSHDSLQQKRFSIRAAWNEQSKYLLIFLPGAVTDYWGRVNDTIRHNIVVNAPDQFGELTLNISGLDSTQQYLILVKSGEQILEQFVIDKTSATQIQKTGMLPGKFTVEVIEDTNRNNMWDTGDYALRRQPEQKMIFILDNLRAGWELESAIMWK